MKAEWNPCHLALIMNVNDPFIVKRPGVSARLPAYRDLLDQRRIKIIAKVDFLQHRSDNHKAVLDWQCQKKRQSRISPVLVLNRATNGDIVLSLSPIIRKTVGKPFNPFCEKEERAVAALAHDFPDVIAPGIGLLNKEIRCEAKREFCV